MLHDHPEVERHLVRLRACALCPEMRKPVVVGRPILSPVVLIGQAPGDKEPLLGRPFAWTAGRTLFKWFESSLGWNEDQVRGRFYFSAVCRCFPGKKEQGGDRVPEAVEIAACAPWLHAELQMLKPRLLLPIGKLAFSQFLGPLAMNDTIGRVFRIEREGLSLDCIPLPHPSGASPWHRMQPGLGLLNQALSLVAHHPAVLSLGAVTPKV